MFIYYYCKCEPYFHRLSFYWTVYLKEISWTSSGRFFVMSSQIRQIKGPGLILTEAFAFESLLL